MIRPFVYAFRSLSKAPAFTAIAIATLTLGIGVNSTLYSLVSSLLFSNAPFPEREQILSVVPQSGGKAAPLSFLSYPEIADLKGRTDIAPTFAAYRVAMENMTLPGQSSEQVGVTAFSPEVFSVLQTQPILGRAFLPEECAVGNNHVILLGYEFWQSRFGGREDAVGQTITINGDAKTIVGVLPRAYSYRFLFYEAELFAPLAFSQEQMVDRERREFGVITRIAPNATLAQTNALLDTVAKGWIAQHPHSYDRFSLRAVQIGRNLDDSSTTVFFLLTALGLAVLLISCSNLANLQLARASSRMKELAIRSALGASRASLIRLQLTEALLLSLVGGLLGLLLAAWLNEIIGRNMKIGINATLPIEIDVRVILFTGIASLITTIGFGLIPAWISSRTDVNADLKSQVRGSSGGRATRFVKNMLVVAQVSLALVLLSTAMGMVTGLRKQLNSPLSWTPDKVLFANVELNSRNYPTGESRRAFHEALNTRLGNIPGIEGHALSSMLPNLLYGGGQTTTVAHERLDITRSDLPQANRFLVTPGYFQTLGLALKRGRIFAETVRETDPEQAVINEALAKQLWPDSDPIGQRLGIKEASGTFRWIEVIGVVAVAEDPANIFMASVPYQFYTAFVREPWPWFQVALRDASPDRVKGDLKQAIESLDPTVSVRLIYNIEEVRRIFLHNVYVVNAILFAVAGLGLVLAAVGLYGIVSNNVQHRMIEFGIRLALGAQPGDLLRMVVVQGMKLTAVGVGVGLVLTTLIGKGMAVQFPSMASDSPLHMIGTVIIVTFVAFAATWLPAREATQADPMNALRAE